MNTQDSDYSEASSKQSKELSPSAISMGLHAAAEEVYSKKDRDALIKIANALRSGATLEGVLSEQANVPVDLKAIIQVGIRTGRLPQLLEEYLSTNRKTRTLWRKFYLSLLYPCVVFAFAFAAITLFLVLIVPQFKEIFNDFGVSLPATTLMVIKIADGLQFLWFPFLIAIAVLIAFIVFSRVLPFAALRSRFLYLLPWVGSAQEMASAAELCSRLAILIDCRVPLHEAMEVVSKTLRDPYMCQLSKTCSDRLKSGASAEEVAHNVPGIPRFLANSFRWANNPETFAESLRSLAIVYSSQARVSTGRLLIIAEPFVFVGVAFFVGFVVVAMFLPLIKLLNELS